MAECAWFHCEFVGVFSNFWTDILRAFGLVINQLWALGCKRVLLAGRPIDDT